MQRRALPDLDHSSRVKRQSSYTYDNNKYAVRTIVHLYERSDNALINFKQQYEGSGDFVDPNYLDYDQENDSDDDFPPAEEQVGSGDGSTGNDYSTFNEIFIRISLRLIEEWDNSLLDRRSVKFQAISKELENEIDQFFINTLGRQQADVIKFQ